jgi:hypothetical protein
LSFVGWLKNSRLVLALLSIQPPPVTKYPFAAWSLVIAAVADGNAPVAAFEVIVTQSKVGTFGFAFAGATAAVRMIATATLDLQMAFI